jgi:ribonuclease E
MDNKTNKMLIDATHPEETRVVVLKNGRVEEFDYESAARKLLRGNIYLAKVTRVEPSLQAAFVEYGGNRHGFLAFSEIHPDYYQIPVSDRQALIDDEAAAEAEADAEADARAERKFSGGNGGNGGGGRREGGREGGRDGGRDGGREGGREGGRDGNRDGGRGRGRNRQRGERTDAAPAGTGPQPGAASDQISTDGHQLGHAAPGTDQQADGHADTHQHTASHASDNHAVASSHDNQDVHHDSHASGHEPAHADAHAPTHDGERAPANLAEATGHDGERVSEAYLTHTHEHDHHDASHAHAGHDHAPHDHGTHDHVGHEHHGDAGHHDTHHDDVGDHLSARGPGADHIEEVADVGDIPETIGAGADAGMEDDGGEDVQERPRRQRRRVYKIQEVIKRRQVILVQVVKEERGNKGAALTTYLSLAGRYTVLMPNTGRGGGISRKIVNPGDRKRLKAIAQELDVPEGMGLIIRTAGAARTSQEIKRDYEYLLRLWESVREMTLQSSAPSLVYEEGNLIKRSIRDLYTKEIDEVVVAGDQAYTDAHDFMRMLMPSHTKNVIRYTQPEALFTRYPIEKQLNAMFSPYVTLKSGGYLVINQTEALVSIDVNSGKSTREYSIEETALATNLEASDEIDMEEKRNNRKVEHRLTDALRFDRARIQVGRISHFGLMEMSRQRMRTGVLEGSTSQCPHCQGTGMIRSTESVALAVLRGLEDHLVKDPRSSVNVMTTAVVALYILNNKRAFIIDIERRYGVVVAVQASDRMQGANFAVERSAAPVTAPRPMDRAAVSMDWGFDGEQTNDHDDHAGQNQNGHEQHSQHSHSHENTIEVVDGDTDGEETGDTEARTENGDGNRNGKRRRRRRGRDRGDRPQGGANAQSDTRGPRNDAAQNGESDFAAREDSHASGPLDEASTPDDGSGSDAGANASGHPGGTGDDAERGARRGRRRGRRGGRRGREQRDENGVVIATADGDGAPGDEGGEPEPHRHEHDQQGGHTDAHVDTSASAPHEHSPHEHTPHEHKPHEQSPPAFEHAAAPEQAPPAHEPAHAPAEHSHADIAPPAPKRREPRRERAPEPVMAEAHASTAPETSPHDTPSVAAVVEQVAAPAKVEPLPVTQLPEAPEDPTKPRRRGWWQRRGLGE